MSEKVPEQIEGKALDCYKSIDFNTKEQADLFFTGACERLLHVNDWHLISGSSSAVFAVTDSIGVEVDRPIQIGDLIRIDIPGPGLPSAGGYDWVQVESLEKESRSEFKQLSLRLRPCPAPTNDNDDTAHFFKRLATSSFVIKQEDRQIIIHYAGRNEVVNTDNSSMLDNFRNFMVGMGAKLGASYPQWKALVEGLSKTD